MSDLTLPDALPLPVREERFCEQMAQHGDPVTAIRAGFGMPTMSLREAQRMSALLLERSDVQERVRVIGQAARALTTVNVATVVAHWWNLATADPNEIVQYRRTCCRYCHGLDHRYQWTPGEYAEQAAKAIDNGGEPPDMSGGLDFDRTRGPLSGCPECGGEGVGEMHVNDTRYLSDRGKLLLESVETTKNGIKVSLHSRTDALANIAKFLGMFTERIKIEDLTRPREERDITDLGNMDQAALVAAFREVVDRGRSK